MLSFHCILIILSDYGRHARDCLEAWTNSSLAIATHARKSGTYELVSFHYVNVAVET